MKQTDKTSKKSRKYIFNDKGVASPHSDEFRRMVAQQLVSGRMTLGEASLKFGVTKNSITSFVRWYKKNTHVPLEKFKKPMTPEEQLELEKLKARVKEVEDALKEADLKIFSLETMITIAERELKIPIRKKSGTKQS